MSNQELAALLEAGSKGPWYSDAMHSVCNLQGGFLRPPQWAIEAKHGIELRANAHLAALAPALAQEVLDRRRVGEELVGTQRSDATEIHGSRHASYSFDDCPTAFCVERRALIARWAELTETEPRAG